MYRPVSFMCIVCRISSTREMCHALKDHVCKIEAAVEQGENDRKEIVEHSSLVDQQYMVYTLTLLNIPVHNICRNYWVNFDH